MTDISLSDHLRKAIVTRWSRMTPEERRKATEPARKARAAKREADKQAKGGAANG